MASKIIVDQLEKTGGLLTPLTLPSVNATTGQYMQNDGSGGLSWVAAPVDTSGFSQASQWRISADLSIAAADTYFYANWEKPAVTEFPGAIGSDMAVNSTTSATLSGAWTFPVTGTWFIRFFWSQVGITGTSSYNTKLWATQNNGSNWVEAAVTNQCGHHNNRSSGAVEYIFNVADVTTDKVRTSGYASAYTVTALSDADANITGFTFFRLGDAS
jgi:hypothetical protein